MGDDIFFQHAKRITFARLFMWTAAVCSSIFGCDEHKLGTMSQSTITLQEITVGQIEEYEAQLRAGRLQLEETERQLAESAENLRQQSGMNSRFSNLLDRWAEQADRFGRLLDRWETLTDGLERRVLDAR